MKDFYDLLNAVFYEVKEFILDDKEIWHEALVYIDQKTDTDPNELSTSELFDIIQDFIYENEYLEAKEMRIIDYYLEQNPDISPDKKELLNGIKNGIKSGFEVKRRYKDRFELERLTSNINYTAYTIGKNTQYKIISEGNYLWATIVKYFENYYIIELYEILPSRSRKEALYRATLELTGSPYSFFEDNLENLRKTEEMIEKMNKAFIDHFNTDLVITTIDCAYDIIRILHKYLQNESDEIKEIEVKKPEKFGYGKESFKYEGYEDAGLLVDPELGLFILPAYGTFQEIFKIDNYNDIQEYDELIFRYFSENSIPPSAILRIYNEVEDKRKFLEILEEPLGYDEIPELDELLKYHKSIYFEKKMVSNHIIHLVSDLTEELTNLEKKSSNNIQIEKVGRNDPCPCGSGKKYKKCCLMMRK